MNQSSRMCRICLLTEEVGIQKLTPIGSQQLADKVFSCFLIHQLPVSHHIPIMICSSCEASLENAIDLRAKLTQAEKFFKNFDENDLNEQLEPDVDIKIENSDIKIEPSDEDPVDVPVENPFYLENMQDEFEFENETETSDGNFKKAKSQKRLQTETSTESSERAFCSKCMKSYKTLKYLKVHEKLVHATEKFICDFCGYRCKTKRSIKYHVIDSHSSSPKDKFICRTCGVAVASKGNLFNHEKTHVEVDPSNYVSCNFCQKSFKDTRLLQNHVQIVHQKLKAVQCHQCNHVSTCQGSLNKHIRTVHQKIRNYTCSECPASFYQKSEFQRHFRTHTGERPYPCTYEGCQRAYPSNKGRKQHMQVCPLRPVAATQ